MPDPWERGYQPGAKDGCRYYCEGPTGAGLAVDLSQELTDMTAGAGAFAYEAASARHNFGAPRAISVRVVANNTNTGEFFRHGPVPNDTRIRINVAGFFQLREAGWTVSVAIPNVAATDRTYEVLWVSAPNPDATGAADAVLSWLLVHDTNDSSRHRFGPWSHPDKISAAADAAIVGAATTGGLAEYDGEIERFSYNTRVMTLAEVEQDFVSTLAAPATTLAGEEQEIGAIPLDQATGIGDVDELQGPTHTWAAFNHRRLRRRLVSGSHVRARNVTTMYADAHSEAPTRSKIRLAPQSSLYRWMLPYTKVYPVSPAVSHVWVSVQLRTWVTGGPSVPLGLRCYSFSRPPQNNGVILPPGADLEQYEHALVTTVVDRDDTASGVGEHVTLGLLPVVRGEGALHGGKTFLALAYAIDPDDVGDADTARFEILDWHVSPAFQDEAGNALGFGGGS